MWIMPVHEVFQKTLGDSAVTIESVILFILATPVQCIIFVNQDG